MYHGGLLRGRLPGFLPVIRNVRCLTNFTYFPAILHLQFNYATTVCFPLRLLCSYQLLSLNCAQKGPYELTRLESSPSA